MSTEESLGGSDPVADTEGEDFAAAIAGEGAGWDRKRRREFGAGSDSCEGNKPRRKRLNAGDLI